jgi:hypothetical protein
MLSSSDGRIARESVEQTWTFATEVSCDLQARNQQVDDAVGAIYAARAWAEAVELNRRDDFADAGRVLKEVARRMREYAGTSSALGLAIAELENAADEASSPMNPTALKAMYYRSGSALRARSLEGKAQRRSA